MQQALKLDKAWWEHLAPKSMISRRREVEALLADFVRSGYGAQWLKVARNPMGVFRLSPGQVIPVVQLTFVGNAPGFVAPFRTLKVGHRTVNTSTEYLSGKILAENEQSIQPLLSVDVVTDPVMVGAAMRRQSTLDESKVLQPSLLFSVPAHHLLSPKHSLTGAYVLYQHIFGNGGSYPNDGHFYVGVTKRSWQQRWAEHRRAIEFGSNLLFHRRFREEKAQGRITYVHHKVMGITNDLESLYAAEEFLVEGHWQDDRRLNMIPGGKSGLRYLRENGLLRQRAAPMPDDRERIVDGWLRVNPTKGLPAPWIAERWRDNAWAVAQICGRDNRLSVQQVRAIRELAVAHSAEEISIRIGAKDAAQVTRVLEGKTYTRVDRSES